jgi:hypothetical protein
MKRDSACVGWSGRNEPPEKRRRPALRGSPHDGHFVRTSTTRPPRPTPFGRLRGRAPRGPTRARTAGRHDPVRFPLGVQRQLRAGRGVSEMTLIVRDAWKPSVPAPRTSTAFLRYRRRGHSPGGFPLSASEEPKHRRHPAVIAHRHDLSVSLTCRAEEVVGTRAEVD